MLPSIRDTSLGHVIRFLSTPNLLRYPDELPDFEPAGNLAESHKATDKPQSGSSGGSNSPSSPDEAQHGQCPYVVERHVHPVGSNGLLPDDILDPEASDRSVRNETEFSPKETSIVSWYSSGTDFVKDRETFN